MSALLGHAPVARPTDPAELTHYLYEKYGQRVFTFCYSRLRSREEAQDAAQTTFIYVLRSLQRGVEPEFELAWLLKIAFNVCRGIRRSAGRETAVTQEVVDIDELAAPPSAGYEGHQRVDALRDALAQLPESQRRGILLREWQGLSYAEIANELGLSLGAVETLLFRARRNLASRLEHVRSGVVGSFNIVSIGPFLRSLWKSGLGKLGLIGASASVALIPVVAAEVAPAFAGKRTAFAVRSATASAPVATKSRQAAAAAGKRTHRGSQAPRALAERGTPSAAKPLHEWPTGAATAVPAPISEPSATEPGNNAPASSSPQVPAGTDSGLPAPAIPSQLPTSAVPTPELPTPQLPPIPVPPATDDALGFVTDALAGLRATVP
jgi:RNA polymerase sigma-70 factor (ECF subfamily)